MPPPPPGKPAPDWPHLRLWQIQPVRDLLLLGAVFGVLYLGYILSIVTVPLLLAMTLAYLLEPLVQAITRRTRRISRQGVAAGLIVVVGLIVIVPLTIGVSFAVVQGAGLAASIASNTGHLVTYVRGDEKQRQEAFASLPPNWKAVGQRVSELKQEADEYRASRLTPEEGKEQPKVEQWKVNLYNVIDLTINWVRDNAAAIGKTLGERAIGTGASAVSVAGKTLASIGVLLFSMLLTAFFFFFLCTGWGRVLAFWEGLIPERKRGRVIYLLQRMDRVIAGFIRGRLIICGILMCHVTIMYFVIGVPVPLILGPIVGCLFLVPFMHVLALPIAMIALWLEPSSITWQQNWWWIVFAPLGVNMSCQILDDYILTPMIQGKNTDMSTPSILFASIAGGSLAGFYGLLLAIPAAACIKILLKEVFTPRFEAWAKGKEKDFLPIARDDPHAH